MGIFEKFRKDPKPSTRGTPREHALGTIRDGGTLPHQLGPPLIEVGRSLDRQVKRPSNEDKATNEELYNEPANGAEKISGEQLQPRVSTTANTTRREILDNSEPAVGERHISNPNNLQSRRSITFGESAPQLDRSLDTKSIRDLAGWRVLENDNNGIPKKDIARRASAPPGAANRQSRSSNMAAKRKEEIPDKRTPNAESLGPVQELPEDPMARIQEENFHLRRQMKSLETYHLEALQTINKLESMHKSADRHISLLKQQLKDTELDCAATKKLSDHSAAQFMTSQREVSALQRRIESLMKKVAARDIAYRARNGNFEDLEKLKNLETKLESTISENENMKVRNKELDDLANSSQKAVRSLEADLQQQKTSYNTKISTLTMEHDEISRGQLRRLNDTKDQLESTDRQLQRLKQDSAREAAELQTRHDKELKDLKKIVQMSKDSLSEQDTTFNFAWTERTAELQSTKDTVLSLNKDLQDHKKEITRLQNSLLKQMNFHMQVMDADLDFLDASQTEIDRSLSQIISKSKERVQQQATKYQSSRKKTLEEIKAIQDAMASMFGCLDQRPALTKLEDNPTFSGSTECMKIA